MSRPRAVARSRATKGAARVSSAARVSARGRLMDLMKTATDIQEAQDQIVNTLREAFHLSRVNILLHNRSTNMLETVSSIGHPQSDFRAIRTPILKMDGISSRAVQVRAFLESRRIIIRNRDLDPEFRMRHLYPYKSFSREFGIFPLTVGKRKLGIISIAVDEKNSTTLSASLVSRVGRLVPLIARVLQNTMPRIPSDRRMIKVMKDILQRRLIYPVYQPIVDIDRAKVFAFEALMRAHHPLVAGPLLLLGYADKFNILRDVSQLMHEATSRALPHLERGQRLFLNLHPADYQEYSDLERRSNPFYGLDPSHFVFEVTERYYVEDRYGLSTLLHYYKSLGFQVAIDDLGSGYSSLNMLTTLEPDYIKLDMSLIRDIDKSDRRRKLVKSLLYFCNQIGCACIAEGVETREEFRVLEDLGCRLIQGFLLARPAESLVPSTDMRRRLKGLRGR
jgi:EAL domain-containing protein (putative c-di-GMP-specific phosphodiesterase class I)